MPIMASHALDVHTPVKITPRAECTACGHREPADELDPDVNGDPTCRDCLKAHAELDDAAEWHTYAYC